MEWRLMGSVPRDRPVLLYIPENWAGLPGMVLAQWDRDSGYFNTTIPYGHDDHSVIGATHWADPPQGPK